MNEFFRKPIVKILMLKGEKGDKGEPGAIQTVNGQAPDASGNVTIETASSNYTELTNKPSINGTELTGNRVLVATINGQAPNASGEATINTVPGDKAEIEKINKVVATKQDKAIKATITLGTTWANLTQSVAVSGITASHNAILDIVTTTSNFETQQAEWAKVYKAETYEGGIKFYAKEATSTALTIQVLAM